VIRLRLLLCLATLLAGSAWADAARTTTRADAARTSINADATLLRELEARYSQCMQAARRGDLEGYWRLRTTASRQRGPASDPTQIRLLAELLPPLDALQFARLDASTKTARVLYRWRNAEVAQYSVVVYRVEQGEWKIEDVSVRRSPSTSNATAAAPKAASQLSLSNPTTVADPGLDQLDPYSRSVLRAWSSGKPDPNRALSAPRL
jgi:hypothetical protein